MSATQREGCSSSAATGRPGCPVMPFGVQWISPCAAAVARASSAPAAGRARPKRAPSSRQASDAPHDILDGELGDAKLQRGVRDRGAGAARADQHNASSAAHGRPRRNPSGNPGHRCSGRRVAVAQDNVLTAPSMGLRPTVRRATGRPLLARYVILSGEGQSRGSGQEVGQRLDPEAEPRKAISR